MIHHPKASMIGATTITKPRILPPKQPSAILPRLMEFQRLIADGMTADAVMRMIEGRDQHKQKLPDFRIDPQSGIPKPRRVIPRSVCCTEAITSAISNSWLTVDEIVVTANVSRSATVRLLRQMIANGSVEKQKTCAMRALRYRLTAPLASQAITMRKNAQRVSEQRSAQSGGYLEGGA